MNPQRYNQVLAKIEANPQHWNQRVWHCGTSHCFAGFAGLIKEGLAVSCDERLLWRSYPHLTSVPWHEGQKWLELSWKEADWLFAQARTLDDFRWVRRMHGRNPD